jgi:hypothetical protein
MKRAIPSPDGRRPERQRAAGNDDAEGVSK